MNFIKRKYYQLSIKYFKVFGTDFQYVKTYYKLKNNRSLNIENPTEFVEKLQWLKFFKYTEAYKNYVDKYEIRAYVKDKIGDAYLNEFIAIYDHVDEIKLDDLPNQFALKGTHGSGYNVIVKDKSSLDWGDAKTKLNKFMSLNYYERYKERIYKDVQPRILAEKYLDQLDNDHIIDYKFYCIHGEPACIWVKTFDDGKYRNCYFDLNWNRLSPDTNKKDYLSKDISKPDNLEELITVAKKLAGDFIFVRVDLYSIENKIYFGELTFFPWAANKRLTVERLNFELGDLIKLPI
ncbi:MULTISPECIES: ATP-grasp fold amidoligase family protein [unclassified Lacinutrix]